MNVNFDGTSVSTRSPLHAHAPKIKKRKSEYLNIRSGDCVELLVRQTGGWAFGVIRKLKEDDGQIIQR